MSDSNKCKLRGKYKRDCKKYEKSRNKRMEQLRKAGHTFLSAWWITCNHGRKESPYEQLSPEDKLRLEHARYAKNPGWWNREMNRVPLRRKCRDALAKIDLNVDCDDLIIDNNNKPNKWYH